MARLKSCCYCGRVHSTNIVCPKKPIKKVFKKITEKDKFRSTKAWQIKREDIKRRDRYMCQICIRDLYNTQRKINSRNLSVHHIVPLEEDYDLREEDNNLKTLCEYHHHLAEKNNIKRDELITIVEEQMKNFY